MNKCRNHKQCRGEADGSDRLCPACREAERLAQEQQVVDRLYRQQNQKPRTPNYLWEIEHGVK